MGGNLALPTHSSTMQPVQFQCQLNGMVQESLSVSDDDETPGMFTEIMIKKEMKKSKLVQVMTIWACQKKLWLLPNLCPLRMVNNYFPWWVLVAAKMWRPGWHSKLLLFFMSVLSSFCLPTGSALLLQVCWAMERAENVFLVCATVGAVCCGSLPHC